MTSIARTLITLVVAVAASSAPCLAATESAQKPMVTTVQMPVRYLTYLPKSYAPKGEPVPLLVFLHGSGESGQDIEKVKVWGPPAMIEKGVDFPFIVISPQSATPRGWNAELLKGMLDDVLSRYNVDRKRIYLTGLSMGGFGAWELAARYPEVFAALAPIAGGWNPREAKRLKDIPTWVFHGKKDDAVPESASAAMVEALKAAGGNVKYTMLPEAGHVEAWVYAYEKAGLFEWFLQQRKP